MKFVLNSAKNSFKDNEIPIIHCTKNVIRFFSEYFYEDVTRRSSKIFSIIFLENSSKNSNNYSENFYNNFYENFIRSSFEISSWSLFESSSEISKYFPRITLEIIQRIHTEISLVIVHKSGTKKNTARKFNSVQARM